MQGTLRKQWRIALAEKRGKQALRKGGAMPSWKKGVRVVVVGNATVTVSARRDIDASRAAARLAAQARRKA